MFIKTGYLHLTYVFLIIAVVRVLDSQSRSPGLKTTWWLRGQLILSSFRSQLTGTGTPGDSVVKNKLSPCSGSIALRQLNPFHKKKS